MADYLKKLKQLLSDKEVEEGIEPSLSPLDLISIPSIGRGLVAPASKILGNEVGAIGNIGKGIRLKDLPKENIGKVIQKVEKEPAGFGSIRVVEGDKVIAGPAQKINLLELNARMEALKKLAK